MGVKCERNTGNLYLDTAGLAFLTSYAPPSSRFPFYPSPLSSLLLFSPEPWSHSKSLKLQIAALSGHCLPSGSRIPLEPGQVLGFSWKWYPAISKKDSFSHPLITLRSSYSREAWFGFLEAERRHEDRSTCPRWSTCWSICDRAQARPAEEPSYQAQHHWEQWIVMFKLLNTWGIVCYRGKHSKCTLIFIPLFFLNFCLQFKVPCSTNAIGMCPLTRVSSDSYFQFSSVQSLSHVQLFGTPWTAARQASLSITNTQSILKLMSIESMMPSNHLILCCSLLLSPSIFPASESFLVSQFFTSSDQSPRLSASASVLPKNIQDWFPLGWTGWISLLSKGLSRVFSKITVQNYQFLVLRDFYSPTLTSTHDYWRKTAFTRQIFVGKVMSLIFNMLSRLIIAFLPKSKCLLISWP